MDLPIRMPSCSSDGNRQEIGHGSANSQSAVNSQAGGGLTGLVGRTAPSSRLWFERAVVGAWSPQPDRVEAVPGRNEGARAEVALAAAGFFGGPVAHLLQLCDELRGRSQEGGRAVDLREGPRARAECN